MKRIVVACMLLLFVHPVRADEIDARAVEKARAFLDATKRGEFVTGFCHFGMKYQGHKYSEMRTVQDAGGRKVASHFALVYDYKWGDDGETRLGFLCDARGNVYKTQAMASNGIVQRPFAVANLSIKLVGEALYDALKEKLSDDDRRLLRQLIDDADAQGLMHLGLRVQQANP
jgi:hypothetical protein